MKRPNILILYTDQQRFDALGASGNADIQTPNLDQMAAEGLRLDAFFVQNPVCMPSRLSFLTGQYPSAFGIFQNGVPVPQDVITLPRLLHNYGYHSANIGKLHFLNHANRDHRQPHPAYGFDHLEISDEPGCYEDAYRAWVRRVAPDQLDHISVGLPPAAQAWQEMMEIHDGIEHPVVRQPQACRPAACRDEVTHTAFVATRTIDYLRQRRPGGDPFLCIAGFYNPHSPWVAPQKFLDIYDPRKLTLPKYPQEVNQQRRAGHFDDDELRSVIQGYYAMVSEVDHHVGRILEALEQTGQAKNTIVIFTSDHGEWLGDHLRYGKGYPGHDPVSRVPCIVRWPAGLAGKGRVFEGQVEAVDIVPTLLEAAAIPVPGHLHGRSLAPLLEGRAFQGRASVLMEGGGWRSIRTENYRYLLKCTGEEELYDLRKPLGDYVNLAENPPHAAALGELRRELARRAIAAERPLPRQWAY